MRLIDRRHYAVISLSPEDLPTYYMTGDDLVDVLERYHAEDRRLSGVVTLPDGLLLAYEKQK